MKIIRHILAQPFVFATGLAALIHSTWSLGTFFSGPQPTDPIALLFWLTPSLLIAFSLDVGQIVTSAEIRSGQRSKAKYATFAAFAIATYYLQFVYIASHMPAIPLAVGVRDSLVGVITLIRDLGVFILPGLLPASTLLYTFSQQEDQRSTEQNVSEPISIEVPSVAIVPVQAIRPGYVAGKEGYEVECPQCDWSTWNASKEGASAALRGHTRKHKKVQVMENA